MNNITQTNFPKPAVVEAVVMKPAPEQNKPQIAAPSAPDLPSRKPSVIAIDTTGVSDASVRESAQPIEQVVQAAAVAIQEFIQSQGSNLSISVDSVTGYHIIRVTDSSGQQVMSLPSEAAIRIAHNMQSLQGLFVDRSA